MSHFGTGGKTKLARVRHLRILCALDMDGLIPVMAPAPGERVQRFVGDRIRFTLRDRDGRRGAKGWRGVLRTNLGRAEVLRREIIQAHTRAVGAAGASWRDLPMQISEEGWVLELPLAEVGYFKAKAYLLDPKEWQHWPSGEDVGIAVHPNHCRTANTIYCAFTRMFGPTKSAATIRDLNSDRTLACLDQKEYTVIPPSGKLRDLIGELPHIARTLQCRILHLLPVHPTPTTYARFGRFGSPYAALDLTAIDPALVTFDRRTTGVDQFRELTYAAHLNGMRVFLDIVINHTGWGSVLQEHHPGWFVREPDGRFVSPGAWGNTWEDLIELRHQHVGLWDKLAEMFLTWCRRGVDGFRCDAGYKVPLPAWQFITARVQQEYPETVFLLEGLGGAWESTEALLTEGRMQWAYSELFQNYLAQQVAGYLDHSLRQNQRVGLLVHYSETHDNPRLAARGRTWSLLRNRLCALASTSGGFGFTCGVEWLATEKISVHGSSGMNWGAPENIVIDLARLNELLASHPCFYDGALLQRLSPPESQVYALLRQSAEGKDALLVLVNTDPSHVHALTFELPLTAELPAWVDLLGSLPPTFKAPAPGKWHVAVPAGGAFCLAPSTEPLGIYGEEYRRARAQAAWAIQALSQGLPAENLGEMDWRELAAEVDSSALDFLAAVAELGGCWENQSFIGAVTVEVLRELKKAVEQRTVFPKVIPWRLLDRRRMTPVPPGHWVLIEDEAPFRAALSRDDGTKVLNVESIAAGAKQIACFAPQPSGDARLLVERYAERDRHVEGLFRFLPHAPEARLAWAGLLQPADGKLARVRTDGPRPTDMVLLTNGRGGMARLCVDLGRVTSKYDCLLGANLHPNLPVDRHILVKRMRAWVNADGFISPLDFRCLDAFQPGPPAVWDFVANAGDGRTVEIQLKAEMLDGRNTTVVQFSRPTAARASGKQLPAEARVRLTVRLDLEDRNFHWETKRNGGADYHFATHTHALAPESGGGKPGFAFTPAPDRQLRASADAGSYHPQPEWSENIPHPIEQSRGQMGSGDAFSPGWFELPLAKGGRVSLIISAEPEDPTPEELKAARQPGTSAGGLPGLENDAFAEQLLQASRAFVVRRGQGKTVIAGYPWFLDWGRDTFICARGLLAAGMIAEVRELLVTFARFEKHGTLPNTIFGEDASNRDTSDAPLWFGLVCEELAAIVGPDFYSTRVGQRESTIADTLRSIALNYSRGTPNGIRMDPTSGLIWSPKHFTWMDTNYPACTPREGYPVEIQALWVRLLRQLERIGGTGPESLDCGALAKRAMENIEQRFWLEHRGWYSDLLISPRAGPATEALPDDALRSNCLFLVSLGLVNGERAKRCVEAALRYLVVPGALRSLAPLPVSVPLTNTGNQGQPLNNPLEPYWGHYEGDEDTRRKPAYHNGTAWTWTFPAFCEALARAWALGPEPLAAAQAYLGSMAELIPEGCIGQLPEILDGDVPHTQRGCDAQAWGATEALRVWKLLRQSGATPPR